MRPKLHFELLLIEQLSKDKFKGGAADFNYEFLIFSRNKIN